MPDAWIDALAATLATTPAFAGCALRRAAQADREFLFTLHRAAMREYVEATWGWDDHWQRRHFTDHFVPEQNAIVLRHAAAPPAIGRVSLTQHWGRIFLRDIELITCERNRGVGSAIIEAVLTLARDSNRYVDLLVLRCNPAQQLYARLGFGVTGDDGARLSMRAD